MSDIVERLRERTENIDVIFEAADEIERLRALTEWRTIESAPRDGTRIAVYGQPDPCEGLTYKKPGVHAAYWDKIDEAFCLDGATWAGPFISPTRWQPLPEPPSEGLDAGPPSSEAASTPLPSPPVKT